VDPRWFESSTNLELCDAVTQLHGVLGVTQASMLAAIAELDRREAFREDGAAAMSDWLVRQLGVSFRTAAQWVRLARALEGAPALAEALATGECSFEQVAPLAEVATPATQAELADQARRCSARESERVARLMRPVTLHDAASMHARRSFRFRWRSGMLACSGELPPEDGAFVKARLERIAEQVPPDPKTGTYEPFDARMADALLECCAIDPASDDQTARSLVVLHCSGRSLDGDPDDPPELAGGPLLAPETARRLGCDSHLQVVVDGGHGEVLSVGRRTRQIPGWLSRRLVERDGGCRFPGCGRTRLVNAHHVVFWSEGGTTDEKNTALLCRYHHRLVHEGGFTLEGDPGGELRFTAPSGRSFTSSPPPLRAEVRARLASSGLALIESETGPPGGDRLLAAAGPPTAAASPGTCGGPGSRVLPGSRGLPEGRVLPGSRGLPEGRVLPGSRGLPEGRDRSHPGQRSATRRSS
jgi:hypothetical protein